MRRYSPPPPRTAVHLCAGIRPATRTTAISTMPSNCLAWFFYGCTSVWANKTANSFAGIRPHGWWYGIRRYSPMDATPVFARTGGCMVCAGIRPTGVHLWYKKNNNRNNDKCKLME
jgi:hypothetical protein